MVVVLIFDYNDLRRWGCCLDLWDLRFLGNYFYLWLLFELVILWQGFDGRWTVFKPWSIFLKDFTSWKWRCKAIGIWCSSFESIFPLLGLLGLPPELLQNIGIVFMLLIDFIHDKVSQLVSFRTDALEKVLLFFDPRFLILRHSEFRVGQWRITQTV